jgi:hypothetical protein
VKVTRASKCNLKYATQAKRDELVRVLAEYGKVVNHFIAKFWDCTDLPKKNDIIGSVYNSVETWLSGTMRHAKPSE